VLPSGLTQIVKVVYAYFQARKKAQFVQRSQLGFGRPDDAPVNRKSVTTWHVVQPYDHLCFAQLTDNMQRIDLEGGGFENAIVRPCDQ